MNERAMADFRKAASLSGCSAEELDALLDRLRSTDDDYAVIVLRDTCLPSLEDLERVSELPEVVRPYLALQNRWGN